jgi:hypothetical protein
MRLYEWQQGRWSPIARHMSAANGRKVLIKAVKATVMVNDKGLVRDTTPKEMYMFNTFIQNWDEGPVTGQVPMKGAPMKSKEQVNG